jgi:ABC-type polysaccharide/polyol phosphate transport system ATPase subunit
MASPLAIQVADVSKRFRIYHQRFVTLKQAVLQRRRGNYEEFWALRDVSFEVPAGSTLGVIGENGSGKSTLLKCVAGILEPEQGTIHIEGRLAALLELGAGFHPDYSGRENIYLNGALLGLPRQYLNTVFDDIVEFSELGRFIDNPVKTYSSGMYARLGFSIAVHLDPDILAIDEVLAVGDEAFQRRCYERISQMKAEGRTMLFVSHDLDAVSRLCTECIWMEDGVVRAIGATTRVIGEYLAAVNAREAAALRAQMSAGALHANTSSKGIGISSVTFHGPDGPAQMFNTGEPFEAAIEYYSPQPLKGVRFTLNLIRQDDVLVFSTATDDLETLAFIFPPEGTVRVRLPELPLLEGVFRASVGMTDIKTEEPYQEIDRVFPFKVRTPPRVERGVALIDHRWELPGEISRAAEA